MVKVYARSVIAHIAVVVLFAYVGGAAKSANANPLVIALEAVAKDPMVIGRTLENFEAMPNMVTKTMGGKVWWKVLDQKDGWRLQCNKLAGNCRILGPSNYRFAWGSRTSMKRAFEVLKKNGMVFYSGRGLGPWTDKTLGGRVFWKVLGMHKGWRLQKNDFSNHCRILDPKDRRVVWGRCPDVEKVLRRLAK